MLAVVHAVSDLCLIGLVILGACLVGAWAAGGFKAMRRLPHVMAVYFAARRSGFWALPAAGRALRFAVGRGLPNRTNRDLLLTLALIERALR